MSMTRYSHHKNVGVVPSGVDSLYRCWLCRTPVRVDQHGRALAHRFIYRGLWGRIIINEPCEGRRHRATKENEDE